MPVRSRSPALCIAPGHRLGRPFCGLVDPGLRSRETPAIPESLAIDVRPMRTWRVRDPKIVVDDLTDHDQVVVYFMTWRK